MPVEEQAGILKSSSFSFSSGDCVAVTFGCSRKSLPLQRWNEVLMAASAVKEDKDRLLIWFMCVVSASARMQVRIDMS